MNLKSRKLWMSLVGIAVSALVSRYPAAQEAIYAVAAIVISYVLGEAHIDARCGGQKQPPGPAAAVTPNGDVRDLSLPDINAEVERLRGATRKLQEALKSLEI